MSPNPTLGPLTVLPSLLPERSCFALSNSGNVLTVTSRAFAPNNSEFVVRFDETELRTVMVWGQVCRPACVAPGILASAISSSSRRKSPVAVETTVRAMANSAVNDGLLCCLGHRIGCTTFPRPPQHRALQPR